MAHLKETGLVSPRRYLTTAEWWLALLPHSNIVYLVGRTRSKCFILKTYF